ncbi:MAG: DUF3160 domain-containing protein [Prolixibacteraceae bacterium]|nr:DUF3160 domain-containing protein [Prolixibacteraceae bacterium]
MKKLYFIYLVLFALTANAQNFSDDEYLQFRDDVKGISDSELEQMYSRPAEYYLKGFDDLNSLNNAGYLDSMKIKFGLTEDELGFLNDNLFFITERLSFRHFGDAFNTIYSKDLPVFISTDAILHALHMSYDKILETIERELMSVNLEEFIHSLYDNFNSLEEKYGDDEKLSDGLNDADIFITIAYSLITDQLQSSHIADTEKLSEVWDAIKAEQATDMPLFTFPTRNRHLDFSQFTVRGHYVYTEEQMWMGIKSLEPYFRTMMWIGRTDFLLTPPPDSPWEMPWSEEEILRMNIGAFMVNEMFQNSDKLNLLQFNEQVINYLVGESDNITPSEYQTVLNQTGISSASQLTDTTTFHLLLENLNGKSEFGQEILSDMFFMDPNSDKPGVLPISYRVSGQRFILDSYVLGNLVFDRLISNGVKIKRMMPKTLDVLFPLGNNDVLPLLKEEFEKYPYEEQLANLRYLVDNKPKDFWAESLYNVWLNSLRELNPVDNPNQPLFMQTAAWHHEKINTQLASWSQLRHDNLLYAKQSYTGMMGCSFPYSYVEPYPDFYASLKLFAENAGNFFSQLPTDYPEFRNIVSFFNNFAEINGKLSILAEKELDETPFSAEENEWLKTMLSINQGECGPPPFSGWFTDLFYDEWDFTETDYTIVDIHTQPTDEFGTRVGKVLHTGVGKVNLGVFLVNSSGSNGELMAFAGPVMSFYEKITEDFKRMTDQEWEEMVADNEVPIRPEWTNIYLADGSGKMKEKSIELPSKLYVGVVDIPKGKNMLTAYPNPVTDQLTLSFSTDKRTEGNILIYNSNGILIKNISNKTFEPGTNYENLSFTGLTPGLYLVKFEDNLLNSTILKVIKK